MLKKVRETISQWLINLANKIKPTQKKLTSAEEYWDEMAQDLILIAKQYNDERKCRWK